MRLVRLASALGLVFAFACGDDGGGNNNVDNTDAGPTVDAAPRPDADVRPAMGECGIVVAPILPFGDSFEANFAGATVIFSNPDGTFIEAATTNDKGEASSDACVRDTMITAVVQDAEILTAMVTSFGVEPPAPEPVGPLMITTYVGVQPGDTVFWGDNTIVADPGPTYANVAITVDQDTSAFPGASSVSVSIGEARAHYPFYRTDTDLDADSCEGTSGTSLATEGVIADDEDDFRFRVDRGCVQPDMSGDAIGWLWDDGVLLATATADVNISYGTAILDVDNPVTLGPWQPVVDPEDALVVTNLPAGQIGGYAVSHQAIGEVTFARNVTTWNFDNVDSSNSMWGPPMGFVNNTVAGAYTVLSQLPFRTTELSTRWAPTDTSELDMSMSLPRIAGVIVTREEPTRPRLSWMSDAPLDGANTGIITTFLTTPGEPVPVAIWTVVTSDPAAGSVQGPILPEAALDQVYGDVSINVWPVAAAFFGFDYQTYNDFITTRGFNPNIQVNPQQLHHFFLPAPLPISEGGDAGSGSSATSKKTSWVDIALLDALLSPLD